MLNGTLEELKKDKEPEGQKPLTASQLRAEIATRYAPPEWLLESELTLASRRLDVVAFNLWGARSHRIVGFEIKVSRGDWLRELNAFQKSEEWASVVDAFYVVTPPKLVQAGELPEGWGHLELCGSRLMTRRHATVREGRSTIPREIAARLVGRLAQRDSDEERTAKWRAESSLSKEIEQRMLTTHSRELKETQDQLTTLRKEHDELLTALGVEPRGYFAHRQALRAAGVFAKATEQGGKVLHDRLVRMADELASHATHLRDAASAVDVTQDVAA
jgi:hypothetical protein